MADAGTVILSRQAGLLRELDTIAHNVANLDTAGFRRGGVVFSEHVSAGGPGGGSTSMAGLRARWHDLAPAEAKPTGAPLDVAIRGEGFLAVQTPDGIRLTRAGHLGLSDAGEIITPDGHPVLSADGASIAIPPDAGRITIAADGEISADGEQVERLGVFVAEPGTLDRAAGTMLAPRDGYRPADEPQVMQGFLEGSNVDAVREIARMIEVQRGYELGRSLMDREHDRLMDVIDRLGRAV